MSGFLDAMARSSRERVADAAAREPLAQLRTRTLDAPPAPALRREEAFGLIAEYKRCSPSQGELSAAHTMERQVIAYASGGAIAVSVLTEPSRFGGDLQHAGDAARALAPLGIPVLRKDFLVDPYQLYESRAVGVGGALLIVRLISDTQLREMLDCAAELGLFLLLETFDALDIHRAASEVVVGVPERSLRISRSEGTPPPDPARGAQVLLGVNCRDLQTLEVRPQQLRELARLLPDDMPRVAESGIATPDDCADAARAGYDLALVGSALMRARDPAAIIRTMRAAARSARQVAA